MYPIGRRWSGGPDDEIRAVLSTAATDAVGYRLPVVGGLADGGRGRRRGSPRAGPARSRLGSGGRPCAGSGAQPDTSIGEALLDQRNLAGLGTFYRAELLFLQGLHPHTPVAQVDDPAAGGAAGVPAAERQQGRSEQSTTGDLRQGRRAYVFERPGQPRRRCGTSIRTDELGLVGRERRGSPVPTLPARALSPDRWPRVHSDPSSGRLAGRAPEQVPSDHLGAADRRAAAAAGQAVPTVDVVGGLPPNAAGWAVDGVGGDDASGAHTGPHQGHQIGPALPSPPASAPCPAETG